MVDIDLRKWEEGPGTSNPRELRKWEEKYANLEKKLDSGFSSEMEEVMAGNGCDVTINPMLYRPTVLLRGVVIKAREFSAEGEINSLFLDGLNKGVFSCGSSKYWYFKDDTCKRIGLKVILRHITYGPSELDEIYEFNSWARYLKYEYPKMVKEGVVPENPILAEFFEGVDENLGTDYVDVTTIFDKVFSNLVEYTFNLIQSGKASVPKTHEFDFDLEHILKYDFGPSSRPYNLGHQLYNALYYFISKRYSGRSVEEFKEKGIIEFFNEYLKQYITGDVEEALKSAIEASDARKSRREALIMERYHRRYGEPVRETFKPTSMF